ncbi:MAG TPA: ATP-binding protein [Gaiellaceae bacterium]|nr:ATP-binding protein [Gaiellaceae bacterium]
MSEQNPFSYGDLALDDTFTNRERELSELESDILNGQNVVLFAPRRYGKTSLVWRATQELVSREGVLVAQIDLMRTPTKEQFAARLAQAIYEQIASPLLRVRERAAQIFGGLRVLPVMTVDPNDGTLGFSFTAGHAKEDVDATIEKLLDLPAELAAGRDRRVAIVFDEFQEVLAIDPHLPNIMRSAFQAQPEIAHVYLGSKRAMMHRLFNDANEPFWRSAKQMELGPIDDGAFAAFVVERFRSTGKDVDPEVVAALLGITQGHPYGTQEFAYALWEVTDPGGTASLEDLSRALDHVLRSENAHFTRIWDEAPTTQKLVLQALALEPLAPITSSGFRRRHGLPASSSVQRALEALIADELVAKESRGAYRIAEPFLAEWVLRFGS